jgi:hypothetical protein
MGSSAQQIFGTSGSGAGASGNSMASLGFQAAAAGVSAIGTSEGDQFRASELEEQAQYGDFKGKQVNAQMTRNLTMTLGNIDAVRAAARTDPTSPTGAAVRDFVDTTGTEQRNIKVDSIMAQAQMDEANAAYLRSASSTALLSGALTAGGDILKAAGPLIVAAAA